MSFAIPVNSSHHQSADLIGDGLRIVARCPDDGVIEALEGTSPDHFVLAVQWHPERSFDEDENSRAIFGALVEAAKQKHEELAGEFEGQPHAGRGRPRHTIKFLARPFQNSYAPAIAGKHPLPFPLARRRQSLDGDGPAQPRSESCCHAWRISSGFCER